MLACTHCIKCEYVCTDVGTYTYILRWLEGYKVVCVSPVLMLWKNCLNTTKLLACIKEGSITVLPLQCGMQAGTATPQCCPLTCVGYEERP